VTVAEFVRRSGGANVRVHLESATVSRRGTEIFWGSFYAPQPELCRFFTELLYDWWPQQVARK
jgi:hypothetical protein